jgi:hypothetical protein
MAETLVEKKTCESCGADVRDGSIFCYNCGGAVSLDPAGTKNNAPENNNFKTTQLKKETLEGLADKPIEKPTVGELLERIEDQPIAKPIEKPEPEEDGKLKSAANMRRKSKSFQKKAVEVVWEEPENAPNKWFPLVAIVLILFVVAIFYLAMYLK